MILAGHGPHGECWTVVGRVHFDAGHTHVRHGRARPHASLKLTRAPVRSTEFA
jgi:hypothetical protein